jgi:hypothetical protein
MAVSTIDRTATIADVIGHLSKPTDYVRQVLDHMLTCRRECGEPSVRIGVTGKGRSPHYRIEYPGDPIPTVFDTFHGASHKKLVDEDFLRDEHWSQRSLSVGEIQTLLGDLRQRRR